MSRLFTRLGAAIVLLVAAAPALAGYRIQEADPEFPEEVTTTWFQEGQVRVEGALEGLTIVMDLKAGEGWLVDAALKRYAGGPFATLAAELRKLDAQALEEAPPPAEEDEAADGGESEEAAPESAPEKPGVVEIKDLGPCEKLLGFETHCSQVIVDGELLEEVWMAPKVDVSVEVDPAAFTAAMQQMLGGSLGLGQGYEQSPAYQKLRAKGYPLRQVLYFVGEKSTLEVTAVTQDSYPEDDFAVPKGFTRIGYGELLVGEGE